MIVETALRIAGTGSHLVHVARPTGVLHIYTGRLTPSGRYVPRTGRTACRAHTRRLSVAMRRGSSLAGETEGARRLCARCSACLATTAAETRQAEPTTRHECRARFAGTTPADVALALEFSTTAAEVDAAAHLSLVLFGHAGCTTPVHLPDGRTLPPLHQLVKRHRGRFVERSAADVAFDELVRSGYAQRKAERIQAKHEREARIQRLGMNNAKPVRHGD